MCRFMAMLCKYFVIFCDLYESTCLPSLSKILFMIFLCVIYLSHPSAFHFHFYTKFFFSSTEVSVSKF